jgi:hypothetical protein
MFATVVRPISIFNPMRRASRGHGHRRIEAVF